MLSRVNYGKAEKLREHFRFPVTDLSGDHFLCCTYLARTASEFLSYPNL